jgi:hypothetical protein
MAIQGGEPLGLRPSPVCLIDIQASALPAGAAPVSARSLAGQAACWRPG